MVEAEGSLGEASCFAPVPFRRVAEPSRGVSDASGSEFDGGGGVGGASRRGDEAGHAVRRASRREGETLRSAQDS